MLTRKQIEKYEDKYLVAYAAKSKDSRGRKHKEAEHPYRSCYQRDRDRIIHSAAFRRLEYKTQVFVIHEGDYYRTRLTHTLEVAQIARTIASALRLNEDLVEAIALAHDLGHTPFGHAGEEALNELMQEHGGCFDHNSQGLRVVDHLEKRYPDFNGLNLTHEVREGISKHQTKFDKKQDIDEFEPDKKPTLEAQVVDIADEIAYDNHDLDDGITSGILIEKKLECIDLWNNICNDIKNKYPGLDDEKRKYLAIKSLINLQVTDIITESEAKIKSLNLKSAGEVRKLKSKVISFSQTIQEQRKPLRNLLDKQLYHHYRVERMSYKHKRFIRELFNNYLSSPGQLPDAWFTKNESDPIEKIICDYIASMTDRYALNEYKRLFDPDEKV